MAASGGKERLHRGRPSPSPRAPGPPGAGGGRGAGRGAGASASSPASPGRHRHHRLARPGREPGAAAAAAGPGAGGAGRGWAAEGAGGRGRAATGEGGESVPRGQRRGDVKQRNAPSLARLSQEPGEACQYPGGNRTEQKEGCIFSHPGKIPWSSVCEGLCWSRGFLAAPGLAVAPSLSPLGCTGAWRWDKDFSRALKKRLPDSPPCPISWQILKGELEGPTGPTKAEQFILSSQAELCWQMGGEDEP